MEPLFAAKDDISHVSDEVDSSKLASENALKRERTPPPDGMSRSAYKRLKRQQEWDAGKADRKAKRKEKDRAKKETRRAAIAAGEAVSPLPLQSVAQNKTKAVQVPVTFVIDCGFDELMTENEIKSLASQITRSYSDNGRARFRVHLAISSFNGRLRERFETVLERQYVSWKGIHFFGEDFVEVAEKAKTWMNEYELDGTIWDKRQEKDAAFKPLAGNGEFVYLSSESENTIEQLDPYCTYIIGGLVDRNRYKGICYKTAMDRGVKTAKLPIGKFLQMNSRYVLATNHVNEIMLHWLEIGDWGEAFMKVIPKRKGGTLKASGEAEDHGEGMVNGTANSEGKV